MARRVLVVAAAVAALNVLYVAGAGAAVHPNIRPNQLFVGLVNGSTGAAGPAQIRVACPGPIRSGETTHPLAHQPLEVLPPASTGANAGNTGAQGTRVSAVLGVPPASGTGAGFLTFRRYGVKKAIPTTLNVPCSGSGFITFVPFPRDPGTSRSFVVPVEYVNIAV